MQTPEMTDEEYLCQQILRKHEEGRPPARNKPLGGDGVEDISNWQGKSKADPTAGTGEGSFCEPQKPELI